MSTIKFKFSPSINIVRDSDYKFNYTPTQNSAKVFSQLLNEAKGGTKCHFIIGAYGTGKSSFLLAYKQTLEGSHKHFQVNDILLKQSPKYEFITVVGDYKSLYQYFAKLFQVCDTDYSPTDVIKAIDKQYKQLQKKGLGIAFILDEFGKFLEYAAQNNPEVELFFMQQLCEWVNNTTTNSVLIGTLHQDFNTYSLSLNKSQQQEWDKIKGRFKEIVFNEPVEQLLFLAGERIEEKFRGFTINNNFDKLFSVIQSSKAFPLKDHSDKVFAKKLYPFDILSAAILTLSLQRYGQNERSLFSFIESDEYLSQNDFTKSGASYYSLDKVYDYLISNYYSVITHKSAKSDFVQWSGIRRALERIDGVLSPDIQHDAQQLIKTIGLLNIFSSSSAQLDRSFYTAYCKLAIGIKHPEIILEKLEKFKILRYVKHSMTYVLFEGTDLDIDLAIDEAGRLIEKTTNVVEQLNQYFDFPFISAKSVYYKKGTPRFFQFKLSDEPVLYKPEGEIDGFINLVFNENDKIFRKIEECSKNCSEAILYGYYKNSAEIQNTLFEIQKAKKVISNNLDDKVAIKELKDIEEHYVRLLNYYVLDSLYSNNGKVIWYYKGTKCKITNRHTFNQKLSLICEDVYTSTPTLKNELLNKTKISGQIASARKDLLERLLYKIVEENIGFVADKFPPEKSIYLSLIREIGLHSQINGIWGWQRPSDNSFDDLWYSCEQFLESTKVKERNLQEFIDILNSKPFKLKQGFIDFWIPIFLLAKSDEYAIFDSSGYIPELTGDVLELLNKKPGMFRLKAFDVAGIKLELFNRYRTFLSQAENSRPTNKLFIQTIKPFLIFYKDLPLYSKNTKRLSKHTISFPK